MSAKIATRVEELARTQAELLEQAAAFRRGHGKIGEQVAGRLEMVSDRLVRELLDDTAGVEATTRLWSTGTSNRVQDDTLSNPLPESDPGKRPRGRPKKAPAGDGLSKPTPVSDVMLTTLDEVTDEERTAACDPARTDQVRDFPALDVQR